MLQVMHHIFPALLIAVVLVELAALALRTWKRMHDALIALPRVYGRHFQDHFAIATFEAFEARLPIGHYEPALPRAVGTHGARPNRLVAWSGKP